MTSISDQNGDLDIWGLSISSRDHINDHADSEPLALCVDLPSIVALESGFGQFSTASVPDGLHAPLFGQIPAAEEEDLETYTVLDAGKITNLPELLSGSGLEHRCLFKGAAYDELKNVAPWLVRLEDGNKFTRNLFTAGDAPWQLWKTEPGLFMRSVASFDDIWRHIRKFTRLQNESGNWFLFRFWETGYLHEYFRYFTPFRPDLIRRLCVTRDEQLIHFVTAALGLAQFQIVTPHEALASTPAAAMILHQDERDFLRAMRWRQNSFEIPWHYVIPWHVHLPDQQQIMEFDITDPSTRTGKRAMDGFAIAPCFLVEAKLGYSKYLKGGFGNRPVEVKDLQSADRAMRRINAQLSAHSDIAGRYTAYKFSTYDHSVIWIVSNLLMHLYVGRYIQIAEAYDRISVFTIKAPPSIFTDNQTEADIEENETEEE